MTPNDARTELLGIVKPGAMIYTVLAHKSQSRMYRVLRLYVYQREIGMRGITRLAADVLGWGYDDKRDGLRAHGCGMDMGFHAVYSLGSALWDVDSPVVRRWATRTGVTRNGSVEYDGGYALNQRWL